MRSALLVIKRGVILNIPLAIIWLLWWWFGGSHSAERLSDRFIIGGMIVCIIGVLFVAGSFTGTGDFNYQYSRSVNSMNSSERYKQDREYHRRSHVHALFFIFVGAISIGIGVLLNSIFS